MATVLTKPLIFLSASQKDLDWRERLKARLNAFERVEWWDDTQIPVGALWAEEIPKALARAKIAVLLLSPDYLESQAATAELNQITTLAAAGLRLFSIVVHACDWRKHDVIARAQVWANGQPLDELRDVEDALQKLAGEIARQALDVATAPPRPDPASAPNPPASFAEEKASQPPAWAVLGGKVARKFRFSEGTERVLTRAGELAERTRRTGLSSSCLLFALAETAGNAPDTSRFVRETMDRTGKYNTVLADFLADLGSRQPERGADRTPSSNVQTMLDTAAELARRSSKALRNDIHRRHLYAALLLTPDGRRQPGAFRRLQALGLDVATLSGEFREYLRTAAPAEDDQGAWDGILGRGPAASDDVKQAAPKGVEPEGSQTASAPSAPYVSGPAGYTSEFVGVGGTQPVTDELGVEGMAHRLAELIALEETKMPLAIGLFGDWGSGKSHFMNLMDRRLKALACARPAGEWCTEIIPIYFNAWHYLDANLWASLITEIFDGLFKHLQPKGDALEAARVQLRAAGGAAARAEEDVTRARAEAKSAAVELQSARDQAASAQRAVDGLLDNLGLLLPRVTSPAVRAQIEEWLGVSAEVAKLSQLAEKHRDLTTVPGRVREMWRRLTTGRDRWWQLGWLVGSLVVVPIVLRYVSDAIPFIRDFVGRFGPLVKPLLEWAIATITAVAPLVDAVRRRLRQIELLQTEAEKAAQDARANKPQVVAAQRQLDAAEAARLAAEAKLADAKALEQRLTQAVEDLLPERRLARFIETRAQSADYRGQLGLVSLARRDFQQLSDIFTDKKALAAKKAKLPPKEAHALETLGASIDRIVLFVDDLDRCQPDKVVDVLQAVHLLLAYPLFAVVVGVDQRCLRQSLRSEFGGLLTGDRLEKRASRQASDSDSDEDERPATPLDYLEKIFHVPFHLPLMNKKGFSDLMTALTKPQDSGQQAKAPDGTTPASGAPPNVGAVLPAGASATGLTVPLASDAAANSLPVGETATNASDTPQVSAPPKTIGSVPLQEWERTAIKDYYSLVTTPRGATRFLNTYRLLRAGIEEREWTVFHGDGAAHGEFRIAMLLLASAAGHPAVARDWFRLLREKAPREVQPADVAADANGWKQFKSVYDATVEHATPGPSRETVVKWIDRVEQFAF